MLDTIVCWVFNDLDWVHGCCNDHEFLSYLRFCPQRRQVELQNYKLQIIFGAPSLNTISVLEMAMFQLNMLLLLL